MSNFAVCLSKYIGMTFLLQHKNRLIYMRHSVCCRLSGGPPVCGSAAPGGGDGPRPVGDCSAAASAERHTVAQSAGNPGQELQSPGSRHGTVDMWLILYSPLYRSCITCTVYKQHDSVSVLQLMIHFYLCVLKYNIEIVVSISIMKEWRVEQKRT